MKYGKADWTKSRNPFRAFAVVCILVTLAPGCGSTPPARFFTLSAAAAPAATPANLSISVGPVSVPAIVDRPQITVSTGPNEVALEEFNRWASPLQNNIARVIAENLMTFLGTSHVTLYPQPTSTDAEYRALIDVQRFDTVPGEAATLDAVWTVRRTKDGKAQGGRTTARETVQAKDFDALAAGHSRALSRLSQDIADAVRALERSKQ